MHLHYHTFYTTYKNGTIIIYFYSCSDSCPCHVCCSCQSTWEPIMATVWSFADLGNRSYLLTYTYYPVGGSGRQQEFSKHLGPEPTPLAVPKCVPSSRWLSPGVSWGFHLSDCLVVFEAGLRRVWPIHPQRHLRVSTSAVFWLVRFPSSLLLMVGNRSANQNCCCWNFDGEWKCRFVSFLPTQPVTYTHVHHAATEQSNGRRRARGGLVCTHGCAHVPQVTLFKHSGVQLGRCPSLCLKPPGNDIHAVPSLPFFLPHKHIFCKLQ